MPAKEQTLRTADTLRSPEPDARSVNFQRIAVDNAGLPRQQNQSTHSRAGNQAAHVGAFNTPGKCFRSSDRARRRRDDAASRRGRRSLSSRSSPRRVYSDDAMRTGQTRARKQ
jgi:hypothetical protein